MGKKKTDEKVTIKLITPENIVEFIQLLTPEDIFGINDGILTSFAACIGEEEIPASIVSAHIYPEHITVKRLFTLPEYRRRHLATDLMDVIKSRPEEAKLPIYVFHTGNEELDAFLKDASFHEEDSKFCFVSGTFGDLVDLPAPAEVSNDIKIKSIMAVPREAVADFIYRSPYDELIQFPDRATELPLFSDASILSIQGKEVKAALLIEESDEDIQITWAYGPDSKQLYNCFYYMKKVLSSDFGTETVIRCLCTGEKTKTSYSKLFTRHEEIKIHTYRFD